MTDDNARIWHASERTAARYADGTLPEPDAWSLEKHLETPSLTPPPPVTHPSLTPPAPVPPPSLTTAALDDR